MTGSEGKVDAFSVSVVVSPQNRFRRWGLGVALRHGRREPQLRRDLRGWRVPSEQNRTAAADVESLWRNKYPAGGDVYSAHTQSKIFT